MLTWIEALERCLAVATPLAPRTMPLDSALGLVTAKPVLADIDDPPFDRSAMDGFAVRCSAEQRKGESLTFRIVGELAAGAVPPSDPLEVGTAVRVMTGAPVPPMTDGVVIVELAMVDAAGNTLEAPVDAVVDHTRRRGEVVRAGQVAVGKYTVVTPEVLGVLGAFGAGEVSVFPRPRVLVRTTGDELVSVDQTPGPGQIRDSNRWAVAGVLREAGAEVSTGAPVADSHRALDEALDALRDFDVLVLTGGVSAGSYDFVHAALSRAGARVDFHKVAMKPGKPVLFAELGSKLVFGLPGNPVSAVVTARLFVAPALRRMMRRPEFGPWSVLAKLLRPLGATGSRTEFVAARLHARGDGFWVEPIAIRGSADTVHHAQCEVLIERPMGSAAAREGEVVRALLLSGFAGESIGKH